MGDAYWAIATNQLGIELRHLRYYLAVVEELHFGRAAERLHIAQPAVSQAVRRLEEELGLQLLNRTSRVVTLTEPGRVLAEEARKALAGVDSALEATLRAGGTPAALRVGCAPNIPMEALRRFVAALEEGDPELRTSVTHASPDDQLAALVNMELDIGIFRDDGFEEIETEPLFAGEPLMAYLPTGHPLAVKQVLGTDDLEQENLIGMPGAPAHAQCVGIRSQLEELGYSFASWHEPESTDPRDLMMAVAEGHGVLLATPSLADATRATAVVECRPMEPMIRLTDVVVAWRADPPHHLRPVLSTVREVARETRGEAGD